MSTYKILFAGDLHKSYKDKSTIIGYRKLTHYIQTKLNNLIKEQGITHFIHLGDWYDKGYINHIPEALSDVQLDLQTNHVTNGNFYGLLGNHARLELHSNPELYISTGDYLDQFFSTDIYNPFAIYKSIITYPTRLIINKVQIEFLHNLGFNDKFENYVIQRQENVSTLIAIGHSDYLMPKDIISYNDNSPTRQELAELFKDTDIFISGHIHTPVNDYVIGKTLCLCRGSLTNTSVKDGTYLNPSIKLPVIEISENGEVKLSNIDFDLEINKVKINRTTAKKVTSTRGNNKSQLNTESEILNVQDIKANNIHNFMTKQGYTNYHYDLVNSICANYTDVNSIKSIVYKYKCNK